MLVYCMCICRYRRDDRRGGGSRDRRDDDRSRDRYDDRRDARCVMYTIAYISI